MLDFPREIIKIGDKIKAQQFLNTQNLQLGWDFTSDVEPFEGNIKTEKDLSQYINAQ
ncbi:MAG: hypothetical protein KGV48_001735 [Alcaligenaceae bacterium]|nr:hypothetical protein [Alcaligenaceae bacterium]